MTTSELPAAGVFTIGSQPFKTQDASLAFSLHLAGVPFQDPTRPCINLYDKEMLKKLGFRGEVNLLECARQAHAAGKRGTVIYIFQRTTDLNDLLNSYTAEQTRIAEAKDTAVYPTVEHLAELIPDSELRLRVAEVILKTRPLFVNLWKDQVPMVAVQMPGEATKSRVGNITEFTFPGVKAVSVNASPELLKRMKL